MKTIKLHIQNNIDLNEELRLYNDVVRFAYNRVHKDNSLKEIQIRKLVNDKFFSKLNSWLIQCAIKEALQIQKRNKDNKVIFGGKSLLKRYQRKLISRDEYKTKKQLPINSQGEKLRKGNRLIDFHFDENYIVLKVNKNKHIKIELPKFRRGLQRELNKLNELINLKQVTVTIKLNNQYVFITYEEKELELIEKYKDLKFNRILGIDLNPNALGLSIIEFNSNDEFKILYKEVISTFNLNDKKVSSNKRKFELIEICHKISSMIDLWKCGKLAIEDLNIKSKDQKKGTYLNRICNNCWDRTLVANKLKMLSNIYGFELIKVCPSYSSLVGNTTFGNENTVDMVAASIEIGRRAYKKYEKDWFWKQFSFDAIDELWKQTLGGAKLFKESIIKIQKSKLKYRFLLLDYIQNAVFRKFDRKSKIEHILFYI